MKMLVVGAGVIGTVYGAHIAAAGSKVSVLSHGPRTSEMAARAFPPAISSAEGGSTPKRTGRLHAGPATRLASGTHPGQALRRRVCRRRHRRRGRAAHRRGLAVYAPCAAPVTPPPQFGLSCMLLSASAATRCSRCSARSAAGSCGSPPSALSPVQPRSPVPASQGPKTAGGISRTGGERRGLAEIASRLHVPQGPPAYRLKECAGMEQHSWQGRKIETLVQRVGPALAGAGPLPSGGAAGPAPKRDPAAGVPPRGLTRLAGLGWGSMAEDPAGLPSRTSVGCHLRAGARSTGLGPQGPRSFTPPRTGPCAGVAVRRARRWWEPRAGPVGAGSVSCWTRYSIPLVSPGARPVTRETSWPAGSGLFPLGGRGPPR